MTGQITLLTAAMASHVGAVRRRNEDIAIIDARTVRDARAACTIPLTPSTPHHLLAVADGVGGNAAGDIASKLVATELSRRLRALPKTTPPLPTHSGEIIQSIREVCTQVNHLVHRYPRQHPETTGLASTLTGILIHTSTPYMINCGDSRIYSYAHQKLQQLTRDHTLRELTGDTRIPGNIIVTCFGCDSEFYVDITPLVITPRQYLLLCSDGLTDALSDAEIAAVFVKHTPPAGADESTKASAPAPAAIAAELITAADAAGSPDNVTVIVSQWQ